MRRALLVLALPAACGGEPLTDASRPLAHGVSFLVSRQAEDGGIRSETYGVLKPGYSLTAIALYAISLCPAQIRAMHASALTSAADFLRHGTGENGAIGLGGLVTDYPSYTSAFYLLALTRLRPAGWRALAERQVRYLKSMQLMEANGWTRESPQYGGFGFGGVLPRKPRGGQDLNISVTRWVLEALAAAGVARTDPVFGKARVFVERCQTESGGFCFTTTPPFNVSKAGGRKPYGTATCDGIRALALCGGGQLPWPWRETGVTRVPGLEGEETRAMGESMRFYYWAALATLPPDKDIRRAIRRVLVARQRADGSWRNDHDLMKEDDPLVATPLALIALASDD